MTNEVSLPQKCVCMRNGVEIWMPVGEKLDRLQAILGSLEAHMFINWEGRSMNTADMVGIFTPEDMEERTRRKNGQRKCKFGEWHDKDQHCACQERIASERRAEEMSVYNLPEPTDEERARTSKALAGIRTKVFKKMP